MRFLFSVLWGLVYVGAGTFMWDVLEVQSPVVFYSVGAVLGLVLAFGQMGLDY